MQTSSADIGDAQLYDNVSFSATAYNIAAAIPAASKLAYTLAIVAGCLFALGALLALLNLIRDKLGVHGLILVFGLERVATYVIRAFLYHSTRRVYFEVYEILETVGFALLLFILWHLWAASRRSQVEATKRGRGSQCGIVFLASIIAAAAAGVFIAGVILQDRASDENHVAHNLRKATTVAYGALLLFLEIACLFLCCHRAARVMAPGLMLASCLCSAKVAWTLYAIWHRPAKYYDNIYWYLLGVLTELLAMLILVTPGFLRRALKQPGPTLPATDHGQFIMSGHQPHSPMFSQGPAIAPIYIK